ncbi:MAG: hypothetical protein RLZZ393_1947, partial [Pseudomonadota bacterium]
VITLVVPGEGRVGPGGTTVVHSSPTWATSSPSGNQIAAYNLATSAYVTLTGALSYTTASNSASALLVNITAGTSFNGTAGNPLVFQFGDAAYIYVRS